MTCLLKSSGISKHSVIEFRQVPTSSGVTWKQAPSSHVFIPLAKSAIIMVKLKADFPKGCRVYRWGRTAKKYSMTPPPTLLYGKLELRFMDVCTLLRYLPHVLLLGWSFFHTVFFFFSSYMRRRRSLDTPSSSPTRNVSGVSLAGGLFLKNWLWHGTG